MSQNPFTFTAMADWIDKTQDPRGDYKFSDSLICACGQYSHALGMHEATWARGFDAEPEGFWYRANKVAGMSPWTWGALAERLRMYEHTSLRGLMYM